MSKVSKHSWHALNEEQIIQSLQTSVGGLTQEEANERLSTFGVNEIKETKKLSRLTLFAKQLKEPLIMLLLAATTISAFIGEIVDAIIIIAIIIITAFVGFIQEYKSERSIEALKKMTSARCRVIRDAVEIIIEVRELVPGDIIIISAGDIVPADGYIIEAFNL
jgi:Ca2+-transporting ATPase